MLIWASATFMLVRAGFIYARCWLEPWRFHSGSLKGRELASIILEICCPCIIYDDWWMYLSRERMHRYISCIILISWQRSCFEENMKFLGGIHPRKQSKSSRNMLNFITFSKRWASRQKRIYRVQMHQDLYSVQMHLWVHMPSCSTDWDFWSDVLCQGWVITLSKIPRWNILALKIHFM